MKESEFIPFNKKKKKSPEFIVNHKTSTTKGDLFTTNQFWYMPYTDEYGNTRYMKVYEKLN